MSRARQFELFASGAFYNGSPVADGYAKFLAAGTTDVKNAYEDKDKSTSCTKKQLDAEGRAEVYGDGIYKIQVYEGDPDNGGVKRIEIDNYKCTAVVGAVVRVLSDYTASRDDAIVLVDTTSDDVTISLDDVGSFDNPIIIKKISASNTLTIDPYSTQLIDSDSTLDLTENNETVELVPDGDTDIWRRTNHIATGLVGLTASMSDLNQLDGVTVGGNSAGDILTTDDAQTLSGVKTFSANPVLSASAPSIIADADTKAASFGADTQNFLMAFGANHSFYSNSVNIVTDGSIRITVDDTDITLSLPVSVSGLLACTSFSTSGSAGITGNAVVGGYVSATGEVSGGSLDINGVADISGNTDVGGDLGVSGDVAVTGDLKTNSRYAVEGLTTSRCVLRSSSLVIQVGTTAGTHISASLQASLFNGDTDSAANLTKGNTVGNWSMNAGGTLITLDSDGISGNCIGVIGYGIYKAYIGADQYTIRVRASSNDMLFEIYEWNSVGAALDWTSVIGATSEILNGYVTYITDA